MTAHDIIRQAASILSSPDRYQRKFAAASASIDGSQTSVVDKAAHAFCMTGLLERAACTHTSSMYLRAGHADALAQAKAMVCLHLSAIHLDGYESMRKPDWNEVREIFESVTRN